MTGQALIAPDPDRAVTADIPPRVNLKIGTHTHYIVELATEWELLDYWNSADRTGSNYLMLTNMFDATGVVDSGDGIDVDVELSEWRLLDLSGGRVYFSLSAWSGTGLPSESIPAYNYSSAPYLEIDNPDATLASLIAHAQTSKALSKKMMLASPKVELGFAEAVRAIREAAFISRATSDPASELALAETGRLKTVITGLEALSLSDADLELQLEYLRLHIRTLVGMQGALFVRDYAVANTLPTAVSSNAFYLFNKFINIRDWIVFGAAGDHSLDTVRNMSVPPDGDLLDVSVREWFVLHIAYWREQIRDHLALFSDTNALLKDHWTTKVFATTNFSLEVFKSLTLPLPQYIVATAADPAVFLAAMNQKYPGIKSAGERFVLNLKELYDEGPQTAAALMALLGAASHETFDFRRFLDELKSSSPAQLVLIAARMVYVYRKEGLSWWLLVPVAVKKLLQLPGALAVSWNEVSAANKLAYALTQLSGVEYDALREELAKTAVRDAVKAIVEDAIELMNYWDLVVAKADHLGVQVVGEEALEYMGRLF